MKYLKIWTNFRELIAPLSDDVKGRLFEAMLIYAETEEEPDSFGSCNSDGTEQFIWNVAKREIDNAIRKIETLQANGSKGGRPEKPKEEPNETNNKPEKTKEKSNETKQEPKETKDKPNKSLYKENDNDNKNIKDAAADMRAREDGSLIDLTEARRIADEHNEVLDAAERAGFKRTDATRAKLIDLYAQYGLDRMLYAIDQCVEYSAINFSYLKQVLCKDVKIPRERGPTYGQHSGNHGIDQGEPHTQHPELIDHTIRV